jgi:hypothetical protein
MRISWAHKSMDGTWVLGFEPAAPMGFAQWCEAHYIYVTAIAPTSAGIAVRVRVRGDIPSELAKAPKARGGSRHELNRLVWKAL